MADITGEDIGDLATIYWWLSGYLSSHTEEDLSSECLDTLSRVINDHSDEKASEPLEPPSLETLANYSFAFGSNGDYMEEE